MRHGAVSGPGVPTLQTPECLTAFSPALFFILVVLLSYNSFSNKDHLLALHLCQAAFSALQFPKVESFPHCQKSQS